jgi:hypothetical protein
MYSNNGNEKNNSLLLKFWNKRRRKQKILQGNCSMKMVQVLADLPKFDLGVHKIPLFGAGYTEHKSHRLQPSCPPLSFTVTACATQK